MNKKTVIKRVWFAIIMLLLLMAVPGAMATVYYVSPNGNDQGLGTVESPFKTIDKLRKMLNPGDTGVFLKGIHRIDKVYRLKVKGVPGKPITLRGQKGAVLQGLYEKKSNQNKFGPDRHSGIAIDGDWMVVENLELVNNAGIGGGGSHIVFRNLYIHDYSNYGIITNGMNHLVIENCRIHGSAIEHGIYLTNRNQDVVIRGCEFYDTAINGIHINGTQNRHILIEKNLFHHNSRDWGACITLLGARNVTIRNNLFYANLGHVFTSGAKKDKKNKKIIYPIDIHIIHNTVYQPKKGRKGAVFVVTSKLMNWIVKNNIFDTHTQAFEFTKDALITAAANFDYNIYGSGTGKLMRRLGKEKNGIFGADIKYAHPPSMRDSRSDLRLVYGCDGSKGAPLLEGAEHGFDGRHRVQDGPFGAYATALDQ